MQNRSNHSVSFESDPWLPRTASMQEFQRIRQIIASAVQVDPDLIQPHTPIGAIISACQRGGVMNLINRKKADNRLPQQPTPASLPRRWVWGLGELTFGLLLSAACIVQPWILVVVTIPVTIIATRIMGPAESVHWPDCLYTMHDLALSQTIYRQADAESGLWPRSEISAKVRWIVAYQSGLSLKEVTEDMSLLDLDCC